MTSKKQVCFSLFDSADILPQMNGLELGSKRLINYRENSDLAEDLVTLLRGDSMLGANDGKFVLVYNRNPSEEQDQTPQATNSDLSENIRSLAASLLQAP